jgi:transcriptional regulator with XRE-family HTH domain
MTEAKTVSAIRRFIKAQTTQRQAAAALGISPGYLSDILKGRRIAPDAVLDRLGLERYSGVRKKKVAA